ncbi:MAG: diguanylate cyclase [Bacteroidetes bacterium GWF2_41_31]|nr:MAG: diguanylate cyclase [Bacteroidetes bacterium GWF2_41_31]OFZ02300.1 MAG: diguanylate cyclase [Bacteroidetes bacterium RIFOXYB12_FULL_41_6]
MADLSTRYLGLNLRNPLVIASSGLTDSVHKIVELEKHGAGAIVLKSMFEEQILMEADYMVRKAEEHGGLFVEYSETFDYADVHVKEQEIGNYLGLIEKSRNEVHIPVIASINCLSSMEWTSFATRMEKAGANALELNIFVMPFNMKNSCESNEKTYYQVLQKVKKAVRIPVAVKISPYFSNLGRVIMGLEENKVDGVVLFNRFTSPDIDINNIKMTVADVISSPVEMANSLRWVALMAKRVNIDLAATTGIHDGEAVVKQLLAGATVVQMASAIYKNGPAYIEKVLAFVSDWMDEKGFETLHQFRGKLSQAKSVNPEVYERLQFMKYFSDYK